MLHSLINGLDELSLLSDSPGTFKVDCNVEGAFLTNRPKVQIFAKFFRLFLLSTSSIVRKPENCSSWLLHHSFVLGSRTTKVTSKRSKDRGQNGTAVDTAWVCGLTPFMHTCSA